MTKLDLKREFDAYQARKGPFRGLTLPPMQYLMVDGHGDPNTAESYSQAIEAIYSVAYPLKFLSKLELVRDYVVMPLEAQWWAGDHLLFTRDRDKSQWNWTLLNHIPDWITADHVEEARRRAAQKDPARDLSGLRFATLDEGLVVQTLHIGSFDDEGPILQHMHEQVIPDNSLEMTGHHHEIYFSDFRRVEPAKLRTILRQPVKRV